MRVKTRGEKNLRAMDCSGGLRPPASIGDRRDSLYRTSQNPRRQMDKRARHRFSNLILLRSQVQQRYLSVD